MAESPERIFERYLRSFIPVTDFMDFRVRKFGPRRVEIEAPIAVNKSRKEIAFGGSICSLCLASGWALLRSHLDEAGKEATILIRRYDTRFLRPVDKDFRAASELVEPIDWSGYAEAAGKAWSCRVAVATQVFCKGPRPCAKSNQEYVLVKERS